jgi:hypothetical protein
MLQVSSLGQSGESALSISDPLLSPGVPKRPSHSVVASVFLIMLFLMVRVIAVEVQMLSKCAINHARKARWNAMISFMDDI